MDVTGNSKSNDLQIACVYPEHETNGVTVRIADYKTLKEICIWTSFNTNLRQKIQENSITNSRNDFDGKNLNFDLNFSQNPL